MNANQFVNRLEEISPTAHDLRPWGVPESVISTSLANYICRPLHPQSAIGCDPLIDLLANFDLSQVEIGMIQLGARKNWVASATYCIVGTVEADGLALRTADSKLVLLDHDRPSFVMSPVAHNGSFALDAFIVVAEALRDLLKFQAIDFELASRRCAAAAMEPGSLGFYRTLLGAL